MTSLCLDICNPMLVIRKHVDKGFFNNGDNIPSVVAITKRSMLICPGPSGLCMDPGIFKDGLILIINSASLTARSRRRKASQEAS